MTPLETPSANPQPPFLSDFQKEHFYFQYNLAQFIAAIFSIIPLAGL
ncbi:hypothetical protein AB4233_07970 [Vibrio sp. 10N.286.45.F3]